MLKRIASRLTDIICHHNHIPEERKPIYVYGLELLLSTSASVISILVISALFNRMIVGFVYLVTFLFFRMVCGGYHAKTYSRCFFSSIITYLLAMFFSTYLYNRLLMIIALIASCLVIVLWAPIPNSRHSLSERMKKRNRRLAIIAMLAVVVLAGSSLFVMRRLTDFVCIIVASMTAVAVLMIIEKMQERRKEHEHLASN